jgi:L-ribulose-5-phosphate 4-epimerase
MPADMLDALRQEVCEANRALERHGLVKLTWGNVSGFDRQAGLLVIKPSGIPYADLAPEQMVVLDLAGKVVEGRLSPSSDAPTHVVLYNRLEGLGGITHAHSPHATMFAQACRAIPCLGTTHADVFHGEVPVTRALRRAEIERDYEASTGLVIVERFARLNPLEMPGVLVAHHGPFTWGRSATDAVANGLALEEIARMAVGTLALAPQAGPIPPPLLDKHFLRKHGPGAYYGQRGP